MKMLQNASHLGSELHFFSGVSAFDQGSDFLNPVSNRKVASFQWGVCECIGRDIRDLARIQLVIEKLFELPAIFLYHLDNF